MKSKPLRTRPAQQALPPPATRAAVPPSPAQHGSGWKVVAEDRVRTCAYYKWQAAGCPPGDGVRFWVEAERELTAAKA